MLDRAERNKKVCLDLCFVAQGLTPVRQHVNTLVYAMALEENDTDKHKKLIELKLTSGEWERVDLFVGLLAVRSNSHLSFHFF